MLQWEKYFAQGVADVMGVIMVCCIQSKVILLDMPYTNRYRLQIEEWW